MKKLERFSVDLSPKTHAVLRVLSGLTGMSKTKIVSSVMDSIRSDLEKSVKALKQVEKKNLAALDTLDSVLSDRRDDLEILSKDVRKMREGYQVDIED